MKRDLINQQTRITNSKVLAAILLIAFLVLSGCKNTNFLSTKDEIALGKSAASEVDKQYRVETKSKDAERVRRIGEKLLAHGNERPGVPYSFKVLDIPDINAVSLPGGPIYIFKGLLDLVGDDDDGLAAIIGHEMGHINARHAAKQISQQMAANVGITLLLKGSTSQNIAGLAENLLTLHYSRDDEYEADSRGLSYAYKAGYDPSGMIRFFKKLTALEKKGGKGDPEFLRTHPLTSGRIDRAEKIIETQNYKYGK